MPNHSFHRASSAGTTLLELILALALSALVMVAVGMAIDLHLRVLDVRRTNVEEAQLARSVLYSISDDLRSAVQFEPPVTPAPGAATPPATSGVPQVPPGNSTSVAPPTTPGLYGNQYQMQVDVSRLPRPDQYQTVMSGGMLAATDIPSDVKTVAYFVQPPGVPLSNAVGAAVDPEQFTGGLVRRELDRAVTTWAANNGDLSKLEGTGQLIAPEVSAIEFQYFDGVEWLPEWDSDEKGGLPIAVKIIIAVDSARQMENRQQLTSISDMTDAGGDESTIYQLIVRLPAAEPKLDEESEEEEPFESQDPT